MLGTLTNLICFSIGILSCFFYGFLAVIPFLLLPKAGFALHRAWGKTWCWLMDIRVTYVGMENLPKNGGYILAPNHESMFDIFVLAASPLEYSWIAKRELLKVPVV